jgi:CRISPR/Cas system CSM-associated protein Csm5 (group 7 of RAMP superfamily)
LKNFFKESEISKAVNEIFIRKIEKKNQKNENDVIGWGGNAGRGGLQRTD